LGLPKPWLGEGYLLSSLSEIKNKRKLQMFLLGAGIRKYAHTEVLNSAG
jgi:hypothetical protein